MTEHASAEQLSAYLDAELDPVLRAGVETHLRECRLCGHHLDELLAVDATVRALAIEPPRGYFDAFAGRVRTRLEAARPRGLPGWAWAAAAALLLAVLTPLTLQRQPAPAAPGTVEEAARIPPAVAPPAPPASAPAAAAPAKQEALAARADERRVHSQPRLERKSRSPEERPTLAAAPRPAAPEPVPVGGESEFATEVPAAKGADVQTAAAPERDQVGAAGSPPTDLPTPSAARLKPRPAARMVPAPPGAVVEGRMAGAVSADDVFLALGRRRAATSGPEARTLRDAWVSFARDYPQHPQADEARVRALRWGLVAYREDGLQGDREWVEREAAAYLGRADARQPARVRALLEELENR